MTSRAQRSVGRAGDRTLLVVVATCGAVVVAVVGMVLAFLVVESREALATVGPWRLVSGASWHPTSATPTFGMAPMIVGSALATAGAVALATPLGILAAVFTRHYAPPLLAVTMRRTLGLLAGIPSVVIGLWGLVVLVPALGQGQGLLPAILVLALMIVPTTALLADSTLAGLPDELRRGAVALGLSRRATVFGVLLPAARRGLGTAVVLATGRALGETMAVQMVAGNVVQLPDSLVAPVRTLTANIALEMAYALDLHRSTLFASGLLLMATVVGLVLAAAWLQRGGSPGAGATGA